jgi:hypothetical protein
MAPSTESIERRSEPVSGQGAVGMIFAIPVGLFVLCALVGRVGERSQSHDIPLTWPSTGYLASRTTRPVPAALVVLAGFVGGLAAGALARAWMRLISTDPEFTVGGTLAIMIGFGLLFAGSGLCLTAHRNGWSRRARGAARTVGCVLILPAFGGAGALAFPSVLFGAVAVARWDLRVPLRLLLASIAVVVMLVVSFTQIVDGELATGRAVAGVLFYPVLLWSLVLAARVPLIRIIHPEPDTEIDR